MENVEIFVRTDELELNSTSCLQYSFNLMAERVKSVSSENLRKSRVSIGFIAVLLTSSQMPFISLLLLFLPLFKVR